MINILGLSIGLFTCILMLLYVDNELKYDTFHENADNIYRVTRVSRFSENLSILATTMGPYAPTILNKNPGAIEKAVRFYKYDALVSVDAENRFQENRLFHFSDLRDRFWMKSELMHSLKAPWPRWPRRPRRAGCNPSQ